MKNHQLFPAECESPFIHSHEFTHFTDRLLNKTPTSSMFGNTCFTNLIAFATEKSQHFDACILHCKRNQSGKRKWYSIWEIDFKKHIFWVHIFVYCVTSCYTMMQSEEGCTEIRKIKKYFKTNRFEVINFFFIVVETKRAQNARNNRKKNKKNYNRWTCISIRLLSPSKGVTIWNERIIIKTVK